ncbi:MAG: UDP-glucose 4-epimerase GalE [Gammaproteobacteria bacterium]|nr:UDP-glucose 4-epimerase GalE [Gammaproteobacteria bacterium]
MAQQGILVTGGAGYIGSHVVRQLGEAGHRIVVLDNLSTGFKEAVLHGELIIGNTGDQPLVSQILKDHDIGAVLHFAANIVVPESVSDPMKYYGNNTCNTRNLLDCCQKAGVSHFIFSSTAAVYGIPDELPASEETPLVPINPYGTSKLMSEWMLRDLAAVCDLSYVVLRYFNVAGANVEGLIGQSTPEATHLIKVACEVATGAREQVAIFGTDYPTEDGTGVRDYIHVDDLASAHLKALDYLRNGGESTTLNCGYGSGFSVRQVLNSVEKCHGSPLKIVEEPRRAGDPPALIAAASKIRETLGWQPKYNDLDLITQTALDWEKKVQAKKKGH